MKKTKQAKRMLAGLLALLLAVTGVPLSGMEVQAEDGVLTEGDYRYEVNEDGNSVTITEYTNPGNSGDAVIPAEINGKKVTSIGRLAFQSGYNLSSITIPDSVTSICESAFFYCSSLTNITIPDSVTSIGKDAFHGCKALTSITIPDGVTAIHDYTFFDCTGLANITIPDSVTSIGKDAFGLCTGLANITIPDSVTYIGENAFNDCTSLANIDIPDKVTLIDERAFSGCTSLANISIPDSVSHIGSYAFNDCTSLVSISIPSSNVEPKTFSGCSNLKELTILDGVISINESAFEGCSNLTNITVSEGNRVYDSRGACNSIIESKSNTLILGCKNTTIPDSVTSIGHSAFSGCSGLTDITIPDSVTSIGYYAFSGCSGLTDITIPDSVTSIGSYAFSGCSGLTGITIPNNAASISDYAFWNCSSLASLIIPDSVTSIGQSAFLGCSSLTSVTIPDSVTFIGDYAFGYIENVNNNAVKEKIPNFTIHGEAGSEAEAYATAVTNNFAFVATSPRIDISNAEITLEKNTYIYDGTKKTPSVMVELNGETLRPDIDYTVSYRDNTEIGTATVAVVGKGNYKKSATESFQIKETVWDENGVYKYQINEDRNSVTLVGYDGGANAEIPAEFDGKSVTAINVKFNFGNYNNYPLASVTIPESVSSIGSYTFYHCYNLKSIRIPCTVTSIGNYAFGFYLEEGDPDNGGDSTEKVPGFIIYGEPGSAAEAYATKYGFPFNQPGTGGNTGSNPSQNGGSQGTATQAEISNATITLEKDSYVYDGIAKTPAVTVTLNGKTLTLNTDYTVAYTNNINVGTAKATVTGKGNYKGSVTKTFSITKANNSAGNNGTSDGNGSAGTSNPKQPITCKKRAYTVAYGTKPFKLKVTSNGSLTYKSSNSKIAAVGKTNGKVTIKNTGITYITAKTKTDSVKITIKVRPAKPKVKSLSTGKNRKLTVKWAKDKRATGYQVQISTSKNFKKNVKKKNTAKTAYAFKKLKAGSKYYVRLRSYKKSGKNTLYSVWSNIKKSGKAK